MLLVISIDVAQVLQQRYVVSIAIEKTCISGSVISVPVLLEVIALQKILYRKLLLVVRHYVRGNEIGHISSMPI
jgi:hypothetical protein